MPPNPRQGSPPVDDASEDVSKHRATLIPGAGFASMLSARDAAEKLKPHHTLAMLEQTETNIR